MHFLFELVAGALGHLFRMFVGLHVWQWWRGDHRTDGNELFRGYLWIIGAVIGFAVVLAGVLFVGNMIFHDVKLPHPILKPKRTPAPIVILTPKPTPIATPTPEPTPAYYLDPTRQIGDVFQADETLSLRGPLPTAPTEPPLPEGAWLRVERLEGEGRLFVEARLSSGESLGRGWLVRP